jgi:hypothetical protein
MKVVGGLLLLFVLALPASALETTVRNPEAQARREHYCDNHFKLDAKGFPGPSPKCRGKNHGYKDLASISSGFQSEYDERREFCKETLNNLFKFNEELLKQKMSTEKEIGQSTAAAAASAKSQGTSFVGLADVHAGHSTGLNNWNKEIIALRMKYAPTGRKIKQRLKIHYERAKMMQQKFSSVPAECAAEVKKNVASVVALKKELERLNANYDRVDGLGKTQMEKNRAAIAESKAAEDRALASAKDLNEVEADSDAPKTAEEWAEYDKKNGYDQSQSTVYNDKETAQKLKSYYESDPKLSALVNGSEEDRMALQRALKTANPNLVVDGQIGRRTLDTLTNTLGNTEQKNAFYRALREQGYNIDTTIRR